MPQCLSFGDATKSIWNTLIVFKALQDHCAIVLPILFLCSAYDQHTHCKPPTRHIDTHTHTLRSWKAKNCISWTPLWSGCRWDAVSTSEKHTQELDGRGHALHQRRRQAPTDLGAGLAPARFYVPLPIHQPLAVRQLWCQHSEYSRQEQFPSLGQLPS